MHVCVHVYVCRYQWVHIHVWFLFTHIICRIPLYIHLYICIYVHAQIYICISVRVHMCVCTYIYIHIYHCSGPSTRRYIRRQSRQCSVGASWSLTDRYHMLRCLLTQRTCQPRNPRNPTRRCCPHPSRTYPPGTTDTPLNLGLRRSRQGTTIRTHLPKSTPQ